MIIDGQGDLLAGLIDDPQPVFTAYKYRFDDLMAGRNIWVKLPCGYCGKIPASLAATNCGGGTTRIEGVGVQYVICGPCGSSGRMNTPPYEQWQIKDAS